MLKVYVIDGKEWLYEEGRQPEGAVELKSIQPPKNKAAKPAANKSRKAVKK